jgi:hypothetical protein
MLEFQGSRQNPFGSCLQGGVRSSQTLAATFVLQGIEQQTRTLASCLYLRSETEDDFDEPDFWRDIAL